MAVPAFLFVEWFAAVLPAGLGFAAGAMVWMVAAQLLPDALRTARPIGVVAAATVSAAAMIGVPAPSRRLSESWKTRNRAVAGLGRDPSLSRLQLT